MPTQHEKGFAKIVNYSAHKAHKFSKLYLLLFIVIFGGLGTYLLWFGHAATTTITGASLAVCNPSPCTNGTTTSYNLPTPPNSPNPAIQNYEVYRPGGLAASPSNKVPAVLVFGGAGYACGAGSATGKMAGNIANTNRIIVVKVEIPCNRPAPDALNWIKQDVNSATPTVPSDEPAVTAIVNAITQCPSSGATSNQCVDPLRIYAEGASSGGNMAADIMCNTVNSPLFRGYEIDSSSLHIYNPAPNQPNCPSTNKNFFVMMALSNQSADASIYNGTAPLLSPQAFTTWVGNRLGCSGSYTTATIFQTTTTYSYSGCGFAVAGSRQVETLGIVNGGHTWFCQDSDATATPNSCTAIGTPQGLVNGLPLTHGLFVDQEFWNLVAAGTSGSGTSTPPPTIPPPATDTTPPSTSITAPTNAGTVSGTATITANASDNVGVVKVEFYVDSALKTSVTASPFSYTWDTTSLSNGTHTLQTKAFDAAGNVGSSSTVSVNVNNTVVGIPTPPVNNGKVALFNSVNYTNSVTDAGHYQIMIMQYSTSLKAKVDALHVTNPSVKILMYQDALYARTSDPLGETVCNTWNSGGGTYGGLNSGWFLKNQSGNIVPNKIAWGGSANYLMDKGNAAYQQSCVAHAISLAKQDNFDGVYWDDNNARLDWNLASGTTVPAYPSPASWQAASVSFLKYAEPLLHAQGLLDFGNIGDDYIGSSDPTGVVWQQFGNYLDGVEQESYTDASVGTAGESFVWLTQVGEDQWAEQNNKYAVLHSQNGTESGNTYGLASMLLVANGLSSYSTANSATSGACYSGTSCEANYPEYTTAQQLGAPSGPSSPSITANGSGYGTGVYTRKFANGIVVVNPTKSTINSVSLGATYSGSGNEPKSVSSVSLAPTSGLILLGNTPPTSIPVVAMVTPAQSAILSGTVSLSATASSTQTITSVQFRVDGSNIGNPVTASPYTTSLDTTKITNGSHDLTAFATDALGNHASSDVIVSVNNITSTPNPTAPSTPQNLNSTNTTINSVSLAWSASTAGTNPLGGYFIVRNGVTIGQTNGITTAYTDNSVQPSQSYNYQVMAYDSINQSLTSGLSNTATISTPAPANNDTQAPTVPANVTAQAASTSQINLGWTASSDNVGVTGYSVYRDGIKIASITTTTFGDTGLGAGSSHIYYVTARDAAGNTSAPSSTASATTQSSPPVVSGVGEVGNVTGSVHNTSGRAISGARIGIIYGGATHYFTTNIEGHYTANYLPVGSHTIRFSKDGYSAQTTTVTVHSKQTTTLNATLRIIESIRI